MTFERRTYNVAPSVERQVNAMNRMGPKIWLQIGFNENLPAFQQGRRKDIKSIDLGDAVKTIIQRQQPEFTGTTSPLNIVMGLGAGSTVGPKKWEDMTMLTDGRVVRAEYQSAYVLGEKIYPGASAISIHGFNPIQGNELAFRGTNIFPIGQVLATEIGTTQKDDGVCQGVTTQDMRLMDLLPRLLRELTVKEGMKIALLIGGQFDEMILRPLRQEGPKEGRPFTATKDADSDVLWVQARSFSGHFVATVDSASYTGNLPHTHAIDIKHAQAGGHVHVSATESPIVKAGAGVVIVGVRNVISVD